MKLIGTINMYHYNIFYKFVLWIYRLQRTIEFNRAKRKCYFSDCAAAYERYRTKRTLLLRDGKIHF